jgi:hypothetical protein
LNRRGRGEEKLLRLPAMQFAPEGVQERRPEGERRRRTLEKVNPGMAAPAQGDETDSAAVVDQQQLVVPFAAGLALVVVVP